MNVLEWIKSCTRYTYENDDVFLRILSERGLDATDSIANATTEQKELMQADLIFTSIFLSPSSTSSISISHNGFSKQVGAETDLYQGKKIEFARYIYKKYNDPNYDIMSSSQRPIKFIQITDKI